MCQWHPSFLNGTFENALEVEIRRLIPSSKTYTPYSIYKHDAIDIADPNSMQDECHTGTSQ